MEDEDVTDQAEIGRPWNWAVTFFFSLYVTKKVFRTSIFYVQVLNDEEKKKKQISSFVIPDLHNGVYILRKYTI